MNDDTKSFPDSNDASDAFHAAELGWLRDAYKAFVSEHISSYNIQRFSHGGRWIDPSRPESDPGEMELHRSERCLRFDDVQNANTKAWLDSIEDTFKQMQASFWKSLIGTVEKSTEKNGNSVDAKEFVNKAEAFLAMMQKIEFGVDRFGHISMPQMLAPEGIGKNWVATLESQPSEFKERFERIKREKTDKALEQERQRKARFKAFSGDDAK